MFNPVHLHTLSVVLSTGSFAEAGRQLGYSSSAVSQQIALLERQLRTALFERDARSIRPTQIALEIGERASSIVGANRALLDDVERIIRGEKGRIRVGSFPSASEHLLPAALSALQRRSPCIDVHLVEGEPCETVPLLESHELDVALVYRYNLVPQPALASISTRLILTEELLLIRPATHGPDELPLLEGLADRTWISTLEDTCGAINLLQLTRSRGLDIDIAYRSNNYAVIQGLVRKGLGVALVPATTVTCREGLSVSALAEARVYREILVASAPTMLPYLVDAFDEAVRTSASPLIDPRRGIRSVDRPVSPPTARVARP